MPGDVLTSRNEYEPSARRIKSSRPQPLQPMMSNAATEAAWMSRSTASGSPQGQKYFVSSEKSPSTALMSLHASDGFERKLHANTEDDSAALGQFRAHGGITQFFHSFGDRMSPLKSGCRTEVLTF